MIILGQQEILNKKNQLESEGTDMVGVGGRNSYMRQDMIIYELKLF